MAVTVRSNIKTLLRAPELEKSPREYIEGTIANAEAGQAADARAGWGDTEPLDEERP